MGTAVLVRVGGVMLSALSFLLMLLLEGRLDFRCMGLDTRTASAISMRHSMPRHALGVRHQQRTSLNMMMDHRPNLYHHACLSA